jgi:uroporphyrinogen-III synthase
LKLLHLAGADRKSTAHPRQKITTVIVYRSISKADVDLGAALDSITMVHSPRAARHLAELIGDGKCSIAIAAISREAADAAGTGWRAVEVAEAPNDEGLLAVTERLCNKVRAR